MPPIFHHLGLRDYSPTWRQMRDFTRNRNADTRDEIWLLQHPPVYTQGVSCNAMPRAGDGAIPLVHSDRGGQITYHGPGQLIAYLLLDLRRRGLGAKGLVARVERLLIDCLAEYGVEAAGKPGAPGVYVDGEKIAALGLRIHRGRCYHGLSLNVDMDLTPFAAIDVCGYEGLEVTQLSAHVAVRFAEVEERLRRHLGAVFG